jgi:hypothetical protein
MAINWDIGSDDLALVKKIVQRADALHSALKGAPLDRVGYEMDIAACHCNGCSLDLEKLLGAPDGDFGHDVFGINRYIDRTTGHLTECFDPRCSK